MKKDLVNINFKEVDIKNYDLKKAIEKSTVLVTPTEAVITPMSEIKSPALKKFISLHRDSNGKGEVSSPVEIEQAKEKLKSDLINALKGKRT